MSGRNFLTTLLLLVLLLTAASIGHAQSATYHLHKDASSTTGLFQLLTDGPNATSFAISSANLKNVAPNEYIIKAFDTQAGVPNAAGTIPANATITFSVWLKKSSTSGVMYPRLKVFLNSSGGTLLGSVTGETALTSTLTQYTFNVNTASQITMSTTDRFYLWVGVNVITAPTSNTEAVLNVEGTLNGNHDSYVTIPLPNTPPTVSLTSPVTAAYFSNPSSITLSANASDSDGINKVEFFQGTTKLGETTTSPYNFTWNNPPPASFEYSLTAKATDNVGLTTTSSAVTVTVAGTGSLFDSTTLPSTLTANLTAEGTSDWVHWGLSTASSVDRKSGVSAQVSNYTKIGPGTVTRFTDSTITHQWSDGTPTASSTGTTTGISIPAVGNGFQITVPADTTARTLRMYVAVWFAQARMEATLSDGSAPAIIDTSFGKAGLAKAVFSINFKAESAGQTLTVKYTVKTDHNAPFGNVALESATLFTPAGGGSGTLSGSLATPAANINLQTEGTADWAHWGHGSVSGFNRKSGVTSEISNINKIGPQALNWLNDNPTAFTWTSGTPASSVTNTRGGIYTFLLNNGFQITVPADTTEKRLRVYVGLWRATGRLEATLSDGSAAPYVDTSLSNSSGTSNGVYTITFKAASAAQSLRIRYINTNLFDPSGNVTLEAATLQHGPRITSLSATSGGVGDAVTITGTSFGTTQGTSTITFNGTTATPTNWTNTLLTVPVPAGATTGNVVVSVDGLTSNSQAFTVKPKILIINPSSAGTGDSVTITGTSFGATQGTSTVSFNGTTASPTSWSDTSIAVPVPAGSSSGPVVVTVASVASDGISFGVAPKITGVSPAIAASGESVVISGTSFGPSQGTSTVTFNGTAATPTSWSTTSITVPVPAGATSGNVIVTVGGLASNEFSFAVASHITSANPTSGAIGDSITITGTDFGATQGTSTITFNGIAGTPSSWSNTSITVPVPAGATSGPLVTTVGGVASNSVSFTVLPKVTAINPGNGAAGEPVTITGTTFGATQGSSTVTFNGVAASPTSWTDTSISVPVPATATTGPVVITVNGNASTGFSFTVTTTVTLNGKVTVVGGTTPVPGATVKAMQGATVMGTTTTNGVGDYTFTSLTVGTYSVEASASGYGMKRKNLVSVITDPTTVNIALDAIVSGPVSYIYDSVGRLQATVGPTDTVIYSYDAVGNLLSISRQNSNVVSIVNFTPGSGPVGTSVTINGTGFSTTASQNTVQFNGTAAVVNSATTTRIVAVVPTGATSGSISVTSPNGSAASSTSFQVGAADGPQITGFSPNIGVLNDSVTISGTNFASTASDNKVRFDNTRAPITSANSTTIVSKVSTTVSSKISVTTPDGTAIATGDFFVPPPPRTVADVEYTNRMSIGQSLTPAISTANKIAMVIFDGQAGQRISIKLGPATNPMAHVEFYRPDGLALIPTEILPSWANSEFIEPFLLPLTGTYTIVVRGDGTTTGGVPVSLYSVPGDLSGSITIAGDPVAATNTIPGENINLTFSGVEGQKVSVLTSGSTMIGIVTIKKPDGTSLGSAFFNPPGLGSQAFIDKQTLPVTGTYTVFVNPSGAATGTTNVRLYDASDSSGTIVAGGSSVAVTIPNPGQNHNLTFEGTDGQRIALLLASTGIAYDMHIKKPDGTTLTQTFINSGWTGSFIDVLTLDASGTYSIYVDPWGAFTGNVTLTLYDVPADLTDSLSVGAAAVPATISAVGQKMDFTFEVTSGQNVTVRITDSTYGCVRVSLLDSTGATLTSASPCISNFNLPTFTLPGAGTYTVRVNPSTTATGTLNVRVTNP